MVLREKETGNWLTIWIPPPADLTSTRTQARTDEELRTIIMEGRPGTKMTGYEIFEDDEIINLVAFIRSLGK